MMMIRLLPGGGGERADGDERNDEEGADFAGDDNADPVGIVYAGSALSMCGLVLRLCKMKNS